MFRLFKFSLFPVLLIFLLGGISLSLSNPIDFPSAPKKGGEFSYYQHYQKFAADKKLDSLAITQIHQQGYWLWWHRMKFILLEFIGLHQTESTFKKAALLNTQNLIGHQYMNLPQRQAYYRWAHFHFQAYGHEIKWMKAADKTTGTLSLALLKPALWLGYSNPEIQHFILSGNELILEDVLPKINKLLNYQIAQKPLKDIDALKWDAQILADEQAIIQPSYEALSIESLTLLQTNLEMTYGAKIALLDITQRWSFGMHLMGYTGITPNMMPEPYSSWNTVSIKLESNE